MDQQMIVFGNRACGRQDTGNSAASHRHSAPKGISVQKTLKEIGLKARELSVKGFLSAYIMFSVSSFI